MPTFEVRAKGFSGSYAGLNITHTVPISKRKCLKFASNIGLPILRAASPTSSHAIALASYKALAIKCAIDFSSSRLCRPSDYQKMDPSEKANISYWTGMTFAAMVADSVLIDLFIVNG